MTIGVARVASAFTRGIDCLASMANNTARQFKADGFDFVGRYLENLTPAERDGIFAANMGILVLTEATSGPLDASVGTARGVESVNRLIALKAPTGLHVTTDLESTHGVVADVELFADAFHDALAVGSQQQMLYVGAGQILTAEQLFARKANRYMRSGSKVPEPACSWCVDQLRPLDQIIHGQRVDVDFIEEDDEGRLPMLWWPS